MVPYDVQLIGGIALHRGKVAEMATGEGKTLVATMPVYLNALAGRGVHLVTVNTYLAQRDSEWMGTIYRYLGLTVDCIDLYEPGTPERRAPTTPTSRTARTTSSASTTCATTWCTTLDAAGAASALLRDHRRGRLDPDRRGAHAADHQRPGRAGAVARSTSATTRRSRRCTGSRCGSSTSWSAEAEKQLETERVRGGREAAGGEARLAEAQEAAEDVRGQPEPAEAGAAGRGGYMREKRLHEVDEMLLYAMDEKGHAIHLSDAGWTSCRRATWTRSWCRTCRRRSADRAGRGADGRREAGPDPGAGAEYAEKSQKIHAIHQLLKAYTLYNRDEQYIIEDGQVIIVDEFTGRKMAGRRWSDGLHQAVEAKENVSVRGETQTLATITIQNYFRMYDKLAGMTGTAETEEGEFHQIYGLEVMVIPTNRPIVRDDRQDLIYRTKREKFNAIMDEIERLHRMQLPVLVGTVSVDVSETLSRMLKRRGIPHNVLNAKYHQQEAQIVAEAGRPAA
jgi:preprotein translocase subunit SecA